MHAQRAPRWPRTVRTPDIDRPNAFERLSSPTYVPRPRCAGTRRRARATRALMMSGTVATRVSLIRCRDPVAVPTRASPTPAHRPTYVHSPRGALESHTHARSECASCPASPDMSEHAEPIYYRPEAPPQASALLSTRCTVAFFIGVVGPAAAAALHVEWSAARAATAAAAAGAAAARRVRRHRCWDRAPGAGRRLRRRSGGAWCLRTRPSA